MDHECSSRHDDIPLAHTDLPDQHGLSGFGLALQLLRLNVLVPSDVFSVFGIRMRYSYDWSYRMATSQAAQQALLTRVPVPEAISSGWDVQSWLPFAGALHKESAWQLRGCPMCFRYGYHTNLFQMPWIARCPWHRTKLITCCQHCRAPLGSSIDRETPLLLCPCGHDGTDHASLLEQRHPFSSGRNRFIDRYLRWAAASRKVCAAFGNDGDNPECLNAIAKLIRLPPALAQGIQIDGLVQGAHERRLVVRIEAEPTTSRGDDFQSCCESFWTRDPTMVEIPKEASASLANVTRSWGARCPVGRLSQIEARRFGVTNVTGASRQPSRMDLVLFPPYSVRERAYFDGRVLARDVYQVLSTLCGSHLSRHREGHVGLSEGLTRRTLAAVLARGYADALALCLTQYVPEVAAHSKRPGMSWHPVVLCRYSRRGGWSHIVWTRRAAPMRSE